MAVRGSTLLFACGLEMKCKHRAHRGHRVHREKSEKLSSFRSVFSVIQGMGIFALCEDLLEKKLKAEEGRGVPRQKDVVDLKA